MNIYDGIQLLLFVGLLTLVTPILGRYIAHVFSDRKIIINPFFNNFEKIIYKFCGTDSNQNMNWKEYSVALIAFNILGIIFLLIIQILQKVLPLNSEKLNSVSWDSALNTSISFVTNTNWQGYSGETTMSYFTQMLGLTVQNFLSASVGLSVAIVLIRGISQKSNSELGNFWRDLIRGTFYVLLPLSIVFAIFLISEGVVQNFSSFLKIITLEGQEQIIPMGPVASQVAIKMLGTNGGGFFNANAAHPFENPTALSNFFQMLAIFLIPAALTSTFGIMTKSKRHGWLIYIVMISIFLTLTGLSLYSERLQNPILGTNLAMEGKETRFGVFSSTFFSTVTTSASCGAVNSMHSSLSPLSGGIALFNMMLGEIIFGGVGAGLYGMLMFIMLTVFLSGLMVGRTPEYLGKKIEGKEIKMIILAVLLPCIVILFGSAISLVIPEGLTSLSHQGAHGFSEVLYAFTSAAANNGSAFAGLNANTLYYNLLLGLAMLVGRFGIILPALAIAGTLSIKNISPSSSGTFEVDTPLFATLLIGVILIVGALTFLPALALGPIVEQLILISGKPF